MSTFVTSVIVDTVMGPEVRIVINTHNPEIAYHAALREMRKIDERTTSIFVHKVISEVPYDFVSPHPGEENRWLMFSARKKHVFSTIKVLADLWESKAYPEFELITKMTPTYT